MPLSPEELRREVEPQIPDQARADFRGEEAFLSRVQVQGEPHWAKSWYRTHVDHRRPGFTLPLNLNAAALSPFFYRVRELEYSIMHQAFPEFTVDMVGAYDPRIRSEANEPVFNMLEGRPVTVTAEAQGDDVLAPQIMQVKREAYARLIPHVDYLRTSGLGVGSHDPTIMAVRTMADKRIQQIVGPDIHLVGPSDLDFGSKSPLSHQQLRSRLAQRSPNNAMIDLIDAGIIPVHPEFNFVPGDRETHPRPPHGTFLEMQIYDPEKLRQWFIRQGRSGSMSKEQVDQVTANLDEYLHCMELDYLYTDLALSLPWGPRENWKLDKDVQTAIYQLVETISEAWERGAINLTKERARIQQQVMGKVGRSFYPQHLALLIKSELTDPIGQLSSRSQPTRDDDRRRRRKRGR